MKKPSWAYHPVVLVASALLGGAFWGGLLFGDGFHVPWLPPLAVGLACLLGLLLSAAAAVPDRLRLRRDRDAYAAKVLRGRAEPTDRLLWVAVLACIMALSWFLWGTRGDLAVSCMMGASVGMLTWYPHRRALWKRMWELYEADQDSKKTLVAAGETPAPRVEG